MATTVATVFLALFGLVFGSAIPLAIVYSIVFVRRNGSTWRTWLRLMPRLLALAVIILMVLVTLILTGEASGGLDFDSTAIQNDTSDIALGLAAIIGLFGGIFTVVLAIRAGRRQRTSDASQRPAPPLSAG